MTSTSCSRRCVCDGRWRRVSFSRGRRVLVVGGQKRRRQNEMCLVITETGDTDAHVDIGDQCTGGGGFGQPRVVAVFVDRRKTLLNPLHQVRGVGNCGHGSPSPGYRWQSRGRTTPRRSRGVIRAVMAGGLWCPQQRRSAVQRVSGLLALAPDPAGRSPSNPGCSGREANPGVTVPRVSRSSPSCIATPAVQWEANRSQIAEPQGRTVDQQCDENHIGRKVLADNTPGCSSMIGSGPARLQRNKSPCPGGSSPRSAAAMVSAVLRPRRDRWAMSDSTAASPGFNQAAANPRDEQRTAGDLTDVDPRRHRDEYSAFLPFGPGCRARNAGMRNGSADRMSDRSDKIATGQIRWHG